LAAHAVDLTLKRILAAVDGSARADHVTAVARAVGASFKAQVHLFRAVRVPQDFPPAAHTTTDNVTAFLIDEAAAGLKALAASYPGVIVEEPMLESGEPWRSILATARRLDVDLIVIGSHGYGGWDRLLGTTAASLVNRADRHVWVVHDRRETE
jgi:nucleotide-binding universal stress UspA family protein